ncbi:MAG TPA: thiamine-phosphate kinase [Acidimicrobiales bacterium]|nr:thiamine-phosphate kinase [Acidimicrobiales bacterium]
MLPLCCLLTYASQATVPEFSLIQRLRERLPRPPGASGDVWIGDDVAVVAGPLGALLLTADAVVAGVHADLRLVGLDDMGWKALVAGLSDIASVGGRPTHALVSVAGPLGNIDFDLLYDGLIEAAVAYECPIVGGDLSAAPVLMVSVAIAGDAGDGIASPVLRSGAAPGDTIFVTGPLGASAAGLQVLRSGRATELPDLALAHRRPRPRLGEGQIARTAGATAMIDVSDGLAADLRHVADSSAVGVVLDRVPVAIGVSRVSDVPEAVALGGGEDYELLFTAPDPLVVEAEFALAGLGKPLAIGRCTADPSERRLRDGELPVLGWEHTW